jgi:molybdopterin biosynthesis enzyme
MAVVLLLATPAGSNAAVIARGADASLAGRIFRSDRAITSKHLALLAAVVVVALLVVARRRILFE